MLLLPGTSEASLLALVNQQNPAATPLVPGDLYYGHVRPSAFGNGMVRLPAVAMYNSLYTGYIGFDYNRVDLSQVFTGIQPKIGGLGEASLHSILPIINQALGLDLQSNDVLDISFQWLAANEMVNISIVADPNSLGYQGSFLLTYTRLRPNLSDVIKVSELTTLSHPGSAVAGKRRTEMLTWGLDFSSYLSNLATYYGMWNTLAPVQEMMALYGFAGWPQAAYGSITGGLTSAYPQANQAYTNVLIQTGVSGVDYQGTAYFHYNKT